MNFKKSIKVDEKDDRQDWFSYDDERKSFSPIDGVEVVPLAANPGWYASSGEFYARKGDELAYFVITHSLSEGERLIQVSHSQLFEGRRSKVDPLGSQ